MAKFTIGCDPEFFFATKGKNTKIIHSGKVIKDDSTKLGANSCPIIRDGVQAEFNPRASSCRAFPMITAGY